MLDFIDRQTAWYYEKQRRAESLLKTALAGQISLMATTVATQFVQSPEGRFAFITNHFLIMEVYGFLYFATKAKISEKIIAGKIKPPPSYKVGGFEAYAHPHLKRGETDLSHLTKRFGQRESLSQHLERMKHTAQTTPNILKK